MLKTVATGLMILTLALPAHAQEKGKTVRLADLEIGLGEAGYGVKQDTAELKAGTSYRMWLKATGKMPCAFQAGEFFKTVTWRKIEVNKVEIKAPVVTEIEFEDEGSAELFFTPTKAGEYTWVCEGLADKGMTGKFVVK
ncbi:MAG: copper-binding protein [Hyphomicrobiaceae bacterium]